MATILLKQSLNNQKGMVALIVTIIVLISMVALAMSISLISFYNQRISTNTIHATQSYYTAESGIEDALIRLKNTPEMNALSYSLTVGNSSTNIVIPAAIGGARSPTSQATYDGLTKTFQVTYVTNSDNLNFYYGVSVGPGGLTMNNGSQVLGNVFSSGNISGSGTISDNVIISGNGNSLSGVYVGGNALTYSCLSGASVNNLTYVTGGTHTCTVRGTTTSQSTPITAQPMPIGQDLIDEWKADAAAGNIVSGNITMNGGTNTLGPAKITGSMTIANGAILTLTGTVHVVGNITISNNAQVKLSSSYGSLGGILMSDGIITINNGSSFSGSGQAGSYVLLLSTNTSNSAITVGNNASGVVVYTSAGGVVISNNVSVVEATGYKVTLSNNATIQYSTGVQNIFFSSGPGGAWGAHDWIEK